MFGFFCSTNMVQNRSDRKKTRFLGATMIGLRRGGINEALDEFHNQSIHWPANQPFFLTDERDFKPSMSVSICDTIRLSTSPLVLSRLGAIESISSMKMMAGAFFSACGCQQQRKSPSIVGRSHREASHPRLSARTPQCSLVTHSSPWDENRVDPGLSLYSTSEMGEQLKITPRPFFLRLVCDRAKRPFVSAPLILNGMNFQFPNDCRIVLHAPL